MAIRFTDAQTQPPPGSPRVRPTAPTSVTAIVHPGAQRIARLVEPVRSTAQPVAPHAIAFAASRPAPGAAAAATAAREPVRAIVHAAAAAPPRQPPKSTTGATPCAPHPIAFTVARPPVRV